VAHRHRDGKAEGRAWHGKAVEWMEMNRPHDEELNLHRVEWPTCS
jgi:hypothetical protein